jgi:hypothetical protein
LNYSSQSSNHGKTSRVATVTSATSSARAHPVSKQQSHALTARPSSDAPTQSSTTSRGVAPTQSSTTSRGVAPTKSLSRAQAAQASSGAPHNDRAQPSEAPHRRHGDQPSSQLHGNVGSGNTRNITNIKDNTSDGNATDTDEDGNVSDTSNPDDNVGVRRRSNKTESAPTQLGFYSGCWVDVLKDAKYHYRLHIHTEEPFPERSRNSLSVAHDCIVEACGKFQKEVKLELDESLLRFFFIGIV